MIHRAIAAALLLSCSPREGLPCVGGLLTPDGGCVAKCDPALCPANNLCTGNRCALGCTSHLECGASQRCVAATEDGTGAQRFVCAAAELHGNGAPCPGGTECAAPAFCLSQGPADATAYCAAPCLADSDCPGGFECGTVRDPHAVCGTAKGNSALCGLTADACLEPAAIALEPYLVEGAHCLERRVCVKRTPCSPCAHDVDCSLMGGRCVQLGASRRCLTRCGKDTDCPAGDRCAGGVCSPEFHDCAAPPAFCSVCRFDSDCGPKLACATLHAGQRACLDPAYPSSCTTDAECPLAASGLRGACLDERYGYTPDHLRYRRCGAPRDSNEAASCYPAH